MGMIEPLATATIHLLMVAADFLAICTLVVAVTGHRPPHTSWGRALERTCRPTGELVIQQLRSFFGSRLNDAGLAGIGLAVLWMVRAGLGAIVSG